MRLLAKITKGTMVIQEQEATLSGQGRFHQQLESCFIKVCKKMEVSVPMWLGKNTRDFVRYKRTSFHPDQFMEPVAFDRLEIQLDDE